MHPFEGIEVVEFGQFIAVPFCAQLLAEGGAHVIKVESLDGDPVRHLAQVAPGETRHFISRNRGKHSLPLDLKHPASRPVIEALLARADVVLTNFRPGFAAEVGLDYASLSARNARLVVGNVSAFGHRGPDAGLAGMDLVVQARSGLMAATGKVVNGVPAVGEPPLADYMCAMTLAFGIASALFRRATTGRGGEVDVALLMAGLTLQNNAMTRIESADGPAHAEILEQLAALRSRGAPHAEQAALMPQIRVPGMVNVYYRTYQTRDAAMAIACVSRGLQKTLMKAVGLTDEALEKPMPHREDQERHYALLRVRIDALMASKTSAEWKAIFAAHGVPAAGVKFPIELLDDEQPIANGMFHDFTHPSVGPIRVLATPIRMDGAGFRPRGATPPFGSEARDILAELGFSASDVQAMLDTGVTREKFGAPR